MKENKAGSEQGIGICYGRDQNAKLLIIHREIERNEIMRGTFIKSMDYLDQIFIPIGKQYILHRPYDIWNNNCFS